ISPCPDPKPICDRNRAERDRMWLVPSRYSETSKDWFWTITRGFVRNYWTFSKNSFFLVDACSSGLADPHVAAFQDALKGRGLGTYLGWNAVVTKGGASDRSKLFFDRVLGANLVNAPTPPQRPFSTGDIFAYFQLTGKDQETHGGA